MSKYLARANYVGSGIKGLLAEGGTKRVETVRASLQSVGATLESFYYAFGDTDVFAIADFPDEATAAAWSLAINSSGAVKLNLVPLMAPEALDGMSAKQPSYRAPGG